jgi:hypothetical protein
MERESKSEMKFLGNTEAMKFLENDFKSNKETEDETTVLKTFEKYDVKIKETVTEAKTEWGNSI